MAEVEEKVAITSRGGGVISPRFRHVFLWHQEEKGGDDVPSPGQEEDGISCSWGVGGLVDIETDQASSLKGRGIVDRGV
jgi:hypothetical protein